MPYELVKKAATEFALDKAVHYVAHDPERNLFTLLDFASRVATRPEHKDSIRKLREHSSQPLILEQARRPKTPRCFQVHDELGCQ